MRFSQREKLSNFKEQKKNEFEYQKDSINVLQVVLREIGKQITDNMLSTSVPYWNDHSIAWQI